MWYSRNCIDCMSISSCENCYELQNAFNCSTTFYSFDVKNCNNSYFLYDCDGCSDCYGCYNQKNQKYMIFNVVHSKSEYLQKLSKILALSFDIQKRQMIEFLRKTGYRVKAPISI